MIPYLPYQRKRFFDFCLEKFQFSHTLHEKQGSAGPGQTGVWENAHDRYGRRAVPRPGDRAARRGAAGHSEARRGHGHPGGDHAGGAGKAPRAVRHAGDAQRQRPGRAGHGCDRDRGSRAAGPAAAGRPGAGAGHRQPAGDGGRSWPPHSPEDPGHHGAAAYPAGAGHPAGGGTGPRRVRGHRADPAAAGGGHGRRSAARSPDLCGQPLQCGGCPAGPHHPVFRHRPAPGGCPTRPASGRRSPGRTGDRGASPP